MSRQTFKCNLGHSEGLGYVTPNTPVLDYSKLISLMSKMDKCLEGTNTKTMDVIKLVIPVFQNQLKKPYQDIKEKMKKMQGNKKTVAEQMVQAYTIGKTSFNKALVQTIITNSSKVLSLETADLTGETLENECHTVEVLRGESSRHCPDKSLQHEEGQLGSSTDRGK